jgi:hypothetical protein
MSVPDTTAGVLRLETMGKRESIAMDWASPSTTTASRREAGSPR